MRAYFSANFQNAEKSYSRLNSLQTPYPCGTTITTQHMLSRAHWRPHGPKRTKKEKEREREKKDNKYLTIEVYSQSKHPEVQVFVSKHTTATARNEGFSKCRKFHPINNKIGEPTSIRANHRPKRGGMPRRDNKRPEVLQLRIWSNTRKIRQTGRQT